MKNIKVILIVAIAAILSSCVKEDFDLPPESTLGIGKKVTIQELKDLYSQQGEFVIDTVSSLYAVVTMDDKTGNIYKTAYIQDHTGAIAIHQEGYGGIYQGDSIRIYLKGLKIGTYRELFQIDAPDGEGFDINQHMIKLDTEVEVEPEVTTISQIQNNRDEYQGKLVKLTNVQFIPDDTSKTYANAQTQESRNTNLINNQGKTIIVRTSGYANFANEPVPNGNGSIIAIVGQYDQDMQLYIRTPEEVNMNGDRFLAIVKNFENTSFGNWTTYNVEGASEWTIEEHYNNHYANMSGYGDGTDNEDWLISPAFDMNQYTNETFSFYNACNYSGNDIQVKVSTNYTEGNAPSTATWTDITNQVTLSTGNWNWVYSGEVDLSSYLTSNLHIAFVYTSTASASKTWEIDDIMLLGNKAK
jgi:hypothetical protein